MHRELTPNKSYLITPLDIIALEVSNSQLQHFHT